MQNNVPKASKMAILVHTLGVQAWDHDTCDDTEYLGIWDHDVGDSIEAPTVKQTSKYR